MAIRKALWSALKRAVAGRAGSPDAPASSARGDAAGRATSPAAGPPGEPDTTAEPGGASGVLARPLEVDVAIPGSLLLDIREPGELASGVAVDALLLPMDAVPHHVGELDRARPITVYCAAGARSLGVAHWLREQGFDAASLESGVQALRWCTPPVPLRVPDRAGERLEVAPGATLDGQPVGPGTVERVDGDRVRLIDATGLQVVGRYQFPEGPP